MTPMKKMVVVNLLSALWSHTKFHWTERKREKEATIRIEYNKSAIHKKQETTCVARVLMNVLLSNSHPFWHSTTGGSVLLEEFISRWNWGYANMWQEAGVPSSCAGIPTVSLSSRLRFPRIPSAFRELISQWWDGMTAIKLPNRKWQARLNRPKKLMIRIIFWNLPNPLISERRSSNFIFVLCCARPGCGSVSPGRWVHTSQS